MSGLLSLRRRRSYGSPHQAAMTFSHCSKDLIRPYSIRSDYKSARTDSYYVPQKSPKARKFSFYFEHGLLGLNGFVFQMSIPRLLYYK